MKKQPQSKIIDCNGVEIYLEDILSLYNLFRTDFKKVEIIIDDYELENFEEISSFDKRKASKVKIMGWTQDLTSEHITLEFEPTRAWIYLSHNDSTLLLGMESRIADFIKQRQKLFSNKWLGLPSLYGSLIMVAIFSLLFKNIDNWFYSGLIVFSFIFALFSLFLVLLQSRLPYNTIYLIKRTDKPNFYEKNRDAIALVLIGAIAGSLLTFTLNYFLGRH